MSEYIEREALRQEIDRIYQKHFAKSREKFIQDTFRAMFKRIDNAPAADVAPVVRGRWMYELADNGWANYMCSKCGYQRNVDVHVVMDWDYCPYCGARMDLEVNSND